MEGASRQLTEWTVDEVSKRIKEKFNEEVAKKFEGKLHICGKYMSVLVLWSDLPKVLSDMLLFNTIIIILMSLT